ncbi:BPTD_3080 family restriction endonuclease [Sulfuritalea sp.]|uniref:BPTD_3080 family restriction endonuclease n=1 Tax=Sulfuritalea sp. TaxID=2480090 RepID=UPI001AC82A94|nr:DEAD/DEAH box helicase family protein [Sulfuritalea sp.]MBN8477145.1 DEAD/DEAH box helicase family protein [Sulfuritalea sp.]
MASKLANSPAQREIPIQPVAKPILCKPFEEPTRHWVYDTQTGDAREETGRRPASYWFKTQRTGSAQMSLLAEEERDDLPLVNLLRDDVKRWRRNGEYRNATPVTRQLLAHWARSDRIRRLFFCQLEAVETVIYINEILAGGKNPGFTPKVSHADYKALAAGDKPSFVYEKAPKVFPTLADKPNEDGFAALTRYGCKMATGSGKTVVMSMLIAWTFCNRGRMPADERFPNAVLVVCPNLTIFERLQVLRTDTDDNYYQQFDIVPAQLMPELQKSKVLISNWHKFAPESPHVESGKSYVVVDKGEESPDAFARRVLGDLHDRAPIMVLNDEAHHAYRPKPVEAGDKLSAEEKSEREEATVWVSGLDRINAACGVKFVVDLSATPFYLGGSGYIEGSPFPWLVSDFGLVDAIESGIVKIPRLPVSDTTGRPEPKFFRLWQSIVAGMQPGEKLPGGKPKPEVVWREAQDALLTLAGQWKERASYLQEAKPGQEQVPPVMIIVADNTNIAELFYKNISGEESVEILEDADEDEDEDEPSSKKKKKAKTRTVFGTGLIFPELFSNRDGFRPTLRIDSKLLAEAESNDAKGSRKEAAEALRHIIDTVGKLGQPGEQVRCVVSVQMLTEGWDANNVTHILGLRAFGSQLLCEQVVGRGLRRMDYTVDPETGLFTEEYVDIYGVPFSVIPFRGRSTSSKAPEDKPKNHVRSDEARKHYEMRFPIVEGYAFALRKNVVTANVDAIEKLILAPDTTPTAVFVKPQVGYQIGNPSVAGGFTTATQDREAYYASTHLQTIKFEIARLVVGALTEGIEGGTPKLRLQGRHQLFPQVFRIVDEYVGTPEKPRKVDFRGCHSCELGLETYVRRIVERLVSAIEPDTEGGEPPLMPRLNRYKPIGTTGEVNFKTTRPCVPTIRSHINQVVADTNSWEQAAVFRLEQARDIVSFYARNDHLELSIPYEYFGIAHSYFPDFLVRLTNGLSLLLEIKGEEREMDRAKHQAARRWVSAVNHWGRLGTWAFHACRDPQKVIEEIKDIMKPDSQSLAELKVGAGDTAISSP